MPQDGRSGHSRTASTGLVQEHVTRRAVRAAVSARCQRLQALEDAIKFRRARLAGPCAECQAAPSGHCDDHGRDAGLIAEYEATARQLPAAQ